MTTMMINISIQTVAPTNTGHDDCRVGVVVT